MYAAYTDDMGLCAVSCRRVAALLTALVLNAPALAYTNPQYRFTATAPQNWKQINVPPGAAAMFVSPLSFGAFSPSINVLVRPLSVGTSDLMLNSYSAVTLEQIKKRIPDSKIISHTATMLSGVPAWQLVYSGTQGQYKLLFTQVYALAAGRAYVLTGTTTQGRQVNAAPTAEFTAFVKTFNLKR
ncbi:hypothetical protein [Deinococcus sp.]|uniref:hypothetical protein n=1 Tax=Deinococcus sp. TaxID=47478 RepID=UPI003B5C085C